MRRWSITDIKLEKDLGNSTKAKLNRSLSCIMAFMMLLVMLFSAFFIVSHTDHDCTGEDCPICACISGCENILYGSGDSSILLAAGILPVVLLVTSIVFSYCVVISGTPVSAKVRMNN